MSPRRCREASAHAGKARDARIRVALAGAGTPILMSYASAPATGAAPSPSSGSGAVPAGSERERRGPSSAPDARRTAPGFGDHNEPVLQNDSVIRAIWEVRLQYAERRSIYARAQSHLLDADARPFRNLPAAPARSCRLGLFLPSSGDGLRIRYRDAGASILTYAGAPALFSPSGLSPRRKVPATVIPDFPRLKVLACEPFCTHPLNIWMHVKY